LARDAPRTRHEQIAAAFVLDIDGRVYESAWRLVLAYTTREQQQLLQAAFLRLRDGLEHAVAEGDQHIERLMFALDPAQRMLAELPYTSLTPPAPASDAPVEQQSSPLTVEVLRDPEEEPPEDEDPIGGGVRVEWLDGAQMCVASLECSTVVPEGALWTLEIIDPPPGHNLNLAIPETTGIFKLSVDADAAQDPRTRARLERDADQLLQEAIERDLQRAITWATEQINEHHTTSG
jgi:hypothetical protein